MKLFVTSLLCFMLLACGKKENQPQMPTPTQSGSNILTCKVNGQIHVYKGKKSAFNQQWVNVYSNNFDESSIVIESYDDKEYHDYLWFEMPTNSLQLGKSYLIAHSEPRSYYDNRMGSYYYFDTTTSSVTFSRFDSTVVSGKFEFSGVNGNNDTVHIIEGWFDISRQ